LPLKKHITGRRPLRAELAERLVEGGQYGAAACAWTGLVAQYGESITPRSGADRKADKLIPTHNPHTRAAKSSPTETATHRITVILTLRDARAERSLKEPSASLANRIQSLIGNANADSIKPTRLSNYANMWERGSIKK